MNWTEIGDKLKNALASVLSKLQRLKLVWNTWPESCRKFVTRLVVGFLILLCLCLFAGCAAAPLDAPSPSKCHAPPTGDLTPTRVPPMKDATGKELVEEAASLREALQNCNKDKKAMMDYIQRRWK